MKELINHLEELSRQAEKGGGDTRIERQHSVRKLAARERIDLLLEKESFTELNKLVTHRCTDFDMEKRKISGNGAVTGYGMIGKRLVYIFTQNFTVFGGTLSETCARKICRVTDMAMQMGTPIIGLNDSGGVRIWEGVRSLVGYAEISLRNSLASGVIPQISAIMGLCTGGAAYSPAPIDSILMVRNSGYTFITGPDVVKSVTQGEVSEEDLGGTDVHIMKPGVAHLSAENDIECISYIHELISHLPGNNMGEPPFVVTTDSPTRLTPEPSELVSVNPNQPYDIKEIVRTVTDDNSFFELRGEFARNIVIGYTHLNGKTIGMVANQPLTPAGTLDINASIRATHFVRFYGASNIPLLTLVDVSGFLPDVDQEYGGIIRSGARLLYTYCEATVPKVTVITRKAYGGVYDVISSKHIRGDVNLAYPTAEIAIMGPDGAMNVPSRKETDKAVDAEAKRKELQNDYHSKFANPYRATGLGYVDGVINSAITHMRLIHNFEMLTNKRQSSSSKKHSDLPL